jgi:tripartite-type tricarboxylate transporter receptor subunit TctC
MTQGLRALAALIGAGLMLAVSAACAAVADAGDYPRKPIRIVIGFTPGGVPDIVARFLAQKLAEDWKQPVVPDNRPGAGGIVAAETVANANPDGYTLLSVSSAHAVAPAVYAKLPYDTLKDFAGVTVTATGPALLIVSPALGVKTTGELIAAAKAKPGQFNFSSAGVGSGTHFAGELFRSMAGVDTVHVPLKGIPEALTEAMTGRVQFFISPFASAIALVRDGRARALAVTSAQRVAHLPELPTVAESGLPGYRWDFWYALLAPARTPRAVIAKLNDEIARLLAPPELRQRWAPLGVEPAPGTPAALDRLIAEEVAAYTRLARAANIRIN